MTFKNYAQPMDYQTAKKMVITSVLLYFNVNLFNLHKFCKDTDLDFQSVIINEDDSEAL